MNIFLTVIQEKADDVAEAMHTGEAIGYTNEVLSYVLGIASVILIFVVSFTLITDMLYLVFPFAKGMYENYCAKEHGVAGKIVTTILVSKHAVEAYKDAAITNQPVMWCYLKRSFKFYIFNTCLIFMCIAGFDLIIGFVYKLVSGWFSNY